MRASGTCSRMKASVGRAGLARASTVEARIGVEQPRAGVHVDARRRPCVARTSSGWWTTRSGPSAMICRSSSVIDRGDLDDDVARRGPDRSSRDPSTPARSLRLRALPRRHGGAGSDHLQRASTLPGMGSTMRQEQEPATDEITEVGPGILRLQLPISMPGLGHVNCYALEDERGVALVDPGLPGPDSLDGARRRGWPRPAIPLARVHTVIVTHSHPDHFGGAGRLRDETGAEIVDAPLASAPGGTPPSRPTSTSTRRRRQRHVRRSTPWDRDAVATATSFAPRRVGACDERSAARSRGARVARRRRPSAARRRRRRSASPDGSGSRVHTPGHTHDHLCLFDPADGVLLSGDHVLPTITPHISGLVAGADPLAQFFASLDRMHDLEGVDLALPAHGHPFARPATAGSRTSSDHHEERLDALRNGLERARSAATRGGVSSHLFSPAGLGSDGRERDLRPPRAPAPDRPRQGHLGRRPLSTSSTDSCVASSPLRFGGTHRPPRPTRRRQLGGYTGPESSAGRGKCDRNAPTPGAFLAQFGIRGPGQGGEVEGFDGGGGVDRVRRCRFSSATARRRRAAPRWPPRPPRPARSALRCSSSARSGARSSRRRASSSSTASQ